MKRDEHAEIRSIILCDSETEKNAVENAFERSIQVIFYQTVFFPFIILNQLVEDYFQNWRATRVQTEHFIFQNSRGTLITKMWGCIWQ